MPKRLSLPLLFLLSLPILAQDAAVWEARLLKALPAPRKHFSLKELPQMRDTVWAAWRRINAAEAGLPATADSLSHAAEGRWPLPAALEPHAVMPFYFGCKGNRPAEGYPLFVYLHGSGFKEREWSTGLALSQRFADAPSLYFIPQIPNEGEWYRWWQRGKQWAWEKLLREVLLRDDVNPNRLYFFGISEGGYGSQRLASFYADYLAAAGPMAGGEPLKNAPAENLRHTPLCLRTGELDAGFFRNQLTACTAAALDSLERLHPSDFRHKVTLEAGRGHAIDYFSTTPWLARFVRNPHPKHFSWEDYEMDGRHRQGFYNLLVSERPDSLLRTRYDLDIEGSTVRITVRNVHYTTTRRDPQTGIELTFARTYTPAVSGRFTVFLDEHLVNLSRPVTIIVNGRRAFKGKLKLCTATMTRAAATFYDPERLYPAAVDVSL